MARIDTSKVEIIGSRSLSVSGPNFKKHVTSVDRAVSPRVKREAANNVPSGPVLSNSRKIVVTETVKRKVTLEDPTFKAERIPSGYHKGEYSRKGEIDGKRTVKATGQITTVKTISPKGQHDMAMNFFACENNPSEIESRIAKVKDSVQALPENLRSSRGIRTAARKAIREMTGGILSTGKIEKELSK